MLKTHLLPTFGGEVEAPEVLVVVKLRLCRTSEFAAKDPELATALGHQHRLWYNKKIWILYKQSTMTSNYKSSCPETETRPISQGSEILIL